VAVMCLCVSYQVFSLFSSKGSKSSPFIVEGRTRTVHVLTIRRRDKRGGVSEPYGLFLWRCGRRSGPSLEHWGDVLVTSDPMHYGSFWATSEQVRWPGRGSLWIGGA